MNIHIIILTRNRLSLLKRCLESVYNAKGFSSVWVVDNESNDGTAEYLQSLKWVNYIKGDNSLGVIARNKAIECITDGICVQVDDDSVLSPHYKEVINKYFSRHEVGAIGQDAHKLTGWFQTESISGVDKECDLVTGYLWAWRADKGWKYDEAYKPFWREETDVQLQIKNDGYKIMKCEDLGWHCSARNNDSIDWELHDKNTDILIKKWSDKIKIW